MSGYTLENYQRKRDGLLTDTDICEENRALFRRFFEYQEYKLRRQNHLAALDTGCIRTLFFYLNRFRNVNKWFGNKPLTQITESDIRRVYDDLEDGRITTNQGVRFKNRRDYYNKVFKSKLFALAGKDSIAKSVIEFSVRDESAVRFVTEEDVRLIQLYLYQPLHRLLVWVAFDIGENIDSLLQLRVSDFRRASNPRNGDPEYSVRLRREILKRSRTPRTELTNYPETVQLLDIHLQGLDPDQRVFDISYRAAMKFLQRAARDAKVVCQPNGARVCWKDMRSGMACDLLKKGWSRDEINARLGHKPSSSEIDKYVNYLAMDRHEPKAKVHQFEVSKLQEQIALMHSRERQHSLELAVLQEKHAHLERRIIDAILKRNPRLVDVDSAIAAIDSEATENHSPPLRPILN